MPILSVIIPVYNVAPYLRACLDSVCVAVAEMEKVGGEKRWTKEGRFLVEVICVDDGSTDGSGEILDEYVERVRASSSSSSEKGVGVGILELEEVRVGGSGSGCQTSNIKHQTSNSSTRSIVQPSFRVIHQKNAGVSAARNAALDIATGEWVMMLDGDDKWAPDLLVRLFEKIDENPTCEAVGFGMVKVDEKGNDLGTFGSESVSAVTTGDGVLLDGRGPMSHFIWSSCDKIYRRSAIERMHLRYRVGMRLSEDSFFAHKFMAQAGVVVLAPEIKGYRYLMREGSAIHTQDTKLPEKPFAVFVELLELWKRIRTPGLKVRLQLMAAAAPSLGKEENFAAGVRTKAIDYLLHSLEFNHKVVPFLLLHGSVKGRIFALVYTLLPSMLRRKLLCRL